MYKNDPFRLYFLFAVHCPWKCINLNGTSQKCFFSHFYKVYTLRKLHALKVQFYWNHSVQKCNQNMFYQCLKKIGNVLMIILRFVLERVSLLSGRFGIEWNRSENDYHFQKKRMFTLGY